MDAQVFLGVDTNSLDPYTLIVYTHCMAYRNRNNASKKNIEGFDFVLNGQDVYVQLERVTEWSRSYEVTGWEWGRVVLERRTAWLDRTKNGTPRGVPLNEDAVAVLESQRGKHPRFCFTYRGRPIAWELTNNAWHSAVRKAGIDDFRFHDLRHTWASWPRQAGTSCDELKDLGGWKSRVMVDRYAKFATEHLAVAAARIEGKRGENPAFSLRSTLARDRGSR